jgi:hypothetical protein
MDGITAMMGVGAFAPMIVMMGALTEDIYVFMVGGRALYI